MGTFRDLRRANIRVLDVDAPEMRLFSRQRANEAREHLLRVIKSPVDPDGKYAPEFFEANEVLIDVLCGRFDCFGRILGDILVDGVSIKDALLRSSHFKPYTKKKSDDKQ